MRKINIRKNTLEALEQLNLQPKIKAAKEEQLHQQLFRSELWRGSQTIGLTYAMSQEINTERIIQQAWAEGKEVFLPKTFPARKMNFFLFEQRTTLEKTVFGLWEPMETSEISKANLDLLVVPGVSFQHSGYRIGYGGGFYDRFLADFTNDTCSLVFQEQLNEEWLPDTFDIPVQQLFIENEKEKR